jgi:hypothetical protein
MGMDVYGKNPASEVGHYFRRNVWGWHPLWEFVENVHPEIAELVEHAHSNDGDGLDAENSSALAKLLMEDYESGKVSEYVVERNKAISEMEMPTCHICEGTGIRSDQLGIENGQTEKELPADIAIIVGRTKGWCNGCNGVGKTEPWEASYYLEPEDVKEFAEFLAECGGFEIC